MDCKPELFDLESLAFFGRVNASISHELKNIMAIISETAGLLSDLSEMAKRGGTIELDMLTESTQSIVEEIQRGFGTIRQMNRFSHSVDTPVVLTDLTQVLDLVSHLSGYLSFAGKMHIHTAEKDAPMAETCPFILQAVIYETVVRIFQQAGSQSQLDVFIRPGKDSGWQIFFDGISIKKCNGFLNEQIQQMAASIGVSLNCNTASDRLEIQVPASLEGVETCCKPLNRLVEKTS